jgi:hypothetical protein
MHSDRAPSSVIETLARDGRPLDGSLRAAMEARLGASLGAVRLHTDSASADSARAIGARAYAAGHHVVFGRGRFAPETAEGTRLLTHELAHVVQQGAGSFPAPASALAAPVLHTAGSPAEREAGHVASSPSAKRVAYSVPAGTVMRAPEGEGESKEGKEESKGVFDTIVGGLIGDFREDPSLAEIAINTGVGLIPAVGEVTAARDVTANVYYMVKKEEYTSPGRWLGLAFALISLFPEIGAALKGLGKAILKGAAKVLEPIIRLIERVLGKLGRSEGLRNFFLKGWAKIAAEGTALFERVMTKLSSLLTRAVRFVSSKAEAFAQGVERVWQIGKKAVGEALEKAKNLIDGVLERFGRKEEATAASEAEKLAQSEQKAVERVKAAEATQAGKETGEVVRAGKLRKTGADTWESSAGLSYAGRDPQGLNRVEHVIRHAEDIPGRAGKHGVFDGGRKATLAVVDEAWAIAEKGGPSVRVVSQGTRTQYIIDMGRRVGYVGGQAGAKAGHPAANFIQIIIEQGNQVISAFPVIP